MLIKLKENIGLIVTFILGTLIWFIPVPDALTEQAWHLFAIFIAMIIGIILKAMPMGSIALIGLSMATLTNTLSLKEALSGFSDEKVIWLVVLSFFVANGFIKTGLGSRVAYYFIKLFGRTTLGLAYSSILSEFLLSPATPSVTARCGGIIYPIVNSISRVLGSKPNSPTAGDAGTFLTLTTIHGSAICCSLFITAVAGNPLVVDIIKSVTGVEIEWVDWFFAMAVPGLVGLIVIPLVLYFLYPPKIKEIPGATEFAKDKLAQMGKPSFHEWIMLGVFVLLIIFWVFGKNLGIMSVTTAFVGVSLLLLTGVLSWTDIVEEKAAWGTFIWFSVLLSMAGFLEKYGVMTYFSEIVVRSVQGFSWPVAFMILILVYYYSHYLFASAVAHVSAMMGAFLLVSQSLGVPPMLAGLTMAAFSSLFGTLTHYGIGPAPVLFGSGYTTLKQWWGAGAIISVLHIVIWVGLGSAWWHFLGYW